jgi:hypothetical protein
LSIAGYRCLPTILPLVVIGIYYSNPPFIIGGLFAPITLMLLLKIWHLKARKACAEKTVDK